MIPSIYEVKGLSMKRFITIITLTALLFGTAGCNILGLNKGVTGKSTKAEVKAHGKVEAINDALVDSQEKKLENIAVFAAGTDYSLNKVTDPPVEVNVAKELNARVMNLADNPNIDELKNIHATVDQLTSNLQEERAKGVTALAERDSKIYDLQLENKALLVAKESEIKKYMDVAQAAAAKADQYSATLNQMDKWFGLGAVFYGLKKFITSMAIIIGVFAFIYLGLRLAASAYPPAATAFSIIDMIASFFIGIIKGLAPGAAKFAKLVPEQLHSIYKETLSHVVDDLEMLVAKEKEDQKKGVTPKRYLMSEILSMFEGSMDQSHKDVVKDVKKDLKW